MSTAFPTMKTILTTDWAPHAEAIARRLAQVCAVVYCLGYVSGAWLHRTSDRLARLWVRLWVPAIADPYMDSVTLLMQWQAPARVITQPQAAVATPANIAPPVIIHISDPMVRAVRMVRTEGRSQRLAAQLCGVSRTSLQRALKG